MTNNTTRRTATLILASGGSIELTDPFILGEGIAGDIAGETRWFSDAEIEQVAQ